MTISRRVSAWVVVALLASFSLSACSEKDKDDSGPTSTASATNSADELTKANFATSMIKAQQKARTSHIEMVIKVGGQKVVMSGDQIVGETLKDNAATMTMDYGDTGPGTAKVVIVDGQFYMNFGPLTDNMFAKADLSDTSDPFTKQLAPMLEQIDISKQIEAMSSAMTSVEKAGDAQKIDGVQAQPYKVVVDTSKMDEFDALPAEARATIPDSVTYKMFLGSDGLLRRMTYGFGGMTGTVNATKWGEPLEIEAPPADEVSDKDLATLLRLSSEI